MKKYIFAICISFSSLLFADVPSNQVKEVSHLLNFIRNSDCIINRNGSEHSGEKGVKHIERKYEYFRDDIKNTEDFIKYSATKSTMSGKYYSVTCSGKKTVKTQQWLLDELARFRSEISANNTAAEITICTEPRPKICTMEYVPVCAVLKDDTVKTYSSACSACADASVVSYKAGAC